MPSPRDHQARIGTFIVFGVQGLSFATVLSRVSAIQGTHQLTDGELTLLLLIVPVLAGIGSVGAGSLATRRGSKWLLRLSQPLVALAVVVTGFAQNIPMLVVALLLFGLAVGAVDAGMNMQGVGVERRYGRAVLNGFHCVWSALSLIGALWTAWVAERLDLSWAMTIPMVLAVAGSVIAAPMLLTPAEEKPAEAAATQTGRFPWKPIIPLCLAMGFLYIGDAAVSNFSTSYMEKVLTASPSVVALAYAAYQATTLLIRLFGDVVVRRYGPAAIVRAGGAIATLGFAGVVLAPNQPLAIVAFGLTGMGLSVVAPQSFSAAGRLDPEGTGVAIARVNLFNYVGFIVGAALVGGIADAADFQIAFAAPLVLSIAIIALARGFEPKVKSAT
ncbi:MFS transporter [Nonomuraea sp. NBC_01738]|uniref:MFS transporter n=1 Tax=Nonomuraea sp. NBC_01738 TaxID=2976003 RepID=UPI002E0EBA67|nr:MFS transporter [Nonomuraea sp. NBC_01738]